MKTRPAAAAILAWAHQAAAFPNVIPHPHPNRLQEKQCRCRLDHHDESRREILIGSAVAVPAAVLLPLAPWAVASAGTTPSPDKQCTDIESCREIGEQKVQQDLQNNPITMLKNGVRYKRLKPGLGSAVVQENDTVDLIYSISRANGAYMYSRGFGFNKVDGIGGGTSTDEGLESYRLTLGRRDVPVGVEAALVGMKKGERRRIEVPPAVGFQTSNWKPEPVTRRGKAQIVDYQSILSGRGTSQPPFPAPTIWDVEVLSFRNARQ